MESPNDVTPTGPYSFYFGNCHKYRDGIRRTIEDKTAYWKWTSVVYCDADVNCKTVAKGFQSANGCLYDDRRKVLTVADTWGGDLYAYKVEPNHDLTLIRKIHTDLAMDNITPILSTGNSLVAGFSDIKAFAQRRKDNVSPCPSVALVLDSKTLTVRPVFKDNFKFPTMTVAAIDETGTKFLGGGVRTDGVFYCAVDSDWEL